MQASMGDTSRERGHPSRLVERPAPTDGLAASQEDFTFTPTGESSCQPHECTWNMPT